MDLFVFECDQDSELNIITFDPDAAKIPIDAKQWCSGSWTYLDSFKEGDGTYTPDNEAEIKNEIAQKGYYLVQPPNLNIDMA